MVDVVRRRGQQIAAETEEVAVACVQTRDGPPTHALDLVRDCDAGDRRAADVIVGDQEGGCDRAHHADLVSDVHQVGPRRRLDFAHDLEMIVGHG